MGTDSSPLESRWWNRFFCRKLKDGVYYLGTIIVFVLCIPSWLIFLYLYLRSPTPCSEQGLSNCAVWLFVVSAVGQSRGICDCESSPSSWVCGGMCRWRCLMGGWHQSPQRRTSWTGFFVSNFEAVSVPVLVRIYQYRNSRLRQRSLLKWTLCQFIDHI